MNCLLELRLNVHHQDQTMKQTPHIQDQRLIGKYSCPKLNEYPKNKENKLKTNQFKTDFEISKKEPDDIIVDSDIPS